MLAFQGIAARAANRWVPAMRGLARSSGERASRYDIEVTQSTKFQGVDVKTILVRLLKPTRPMRVDFAGSRVEVLDVMIPGSPQGEVTVTVDANTEIQALNLLPTDQIVVARESLPEGTVPASLQFFPGNDSASDRKYHVQSHGMKMWRKDPGCSGKTYARTDEAIHRYVEAEPTV